MANFASNTKKEWDRIQAFEQAVIKAKD